LSTAFPLLLVLCFVVFYFIQYFCHFVVVLC
jgi:hypothetical protein